MWRIPALVGLTSVAFTTASAAEEEAGCEATVVVGAGPFYQGGAPERAFVCDPATSNDQHPVLHMSGVIYGTGNSGECVPVTGVEVHVWQITEEDFYDDHENLSTHKCRAIITPDETGAYSFTTIKPKPYETRRSTPENPSYRPPHLHFMVVDKSGEWAGMTTQMYFKGDPYQGEDDGCQRCNSYEQSLHVEAAEREDGSLEATFDIGLSPFESSAPTFAPIVEVPSTRFPTFPPSAVPTSSPSDVVVPEPCPEITCTALPPNCLLSLDGEVRVLDNGCRVTECDTCVELGPTVPEVLNPASRGISVMYDAGGDFLGCEEGPTAFMNDCVGITNFLFATVAAEPVVVDDVSCIDLYSKYVEETDTYPDPMYSDVTMYYPGGFFGAENALDDLLDNRAHLERWQRENIALVDSCTPLTCEAITNKKVCRAQGCRYSKKKGCRAKDSGEEDRVCGDVGVRLLENADCGADCSFSMKKVASACECEDACDGRAYTFGTRNTRCICFEDGRFVREDKFKNLFISGNYA